MRVLIGSEALSAGVLSRHDLTAVYRRLLPDVYAPKSATLTLDDRIAAAWLWSKRQGVFTGVSASALHGSKWIGDQMRIEMNLGHNKSPGGVITRRDTLLSDEVVRVGAMALTSVERTAFDLARRESVAKAVERLDALARATNFKVDDVLTVADRHPRVRGRRRVPGVLALVDAGAQSPKETWLRLLLINAGFPRPQTQIPVSAPDGYALYYLDMGWEEFRVTAEYDGQQHRVDPIQYRHDVQRSEYIVARGWRRIAVLAGDRAPDIVRRVEQAGVPRNSH